MSNLDDIRKRAGHTEDVQILLRIATEQEAELAEANRKLTEIKDVLYGQGLQVAGWHQNGDLEPMDSFFESNDWEPTRKEAK